ncbi:AraC family transcriptional regulator [Paenibacillus borealis]|uniref:AraC family transcriptional regulator n=1 Tax=Paenibacillus borealis TaxID=160799 RepID=UPI0005A735F5|nr:AraC family transcriptional regulator [Paenibacillus borealis]
MRENWSVHPAAYTYWEKKEQFLLEYDTYPVWTIFAVEQGQFAYRFGDHEGEAGLGDIIVCPPGTAFYRRTVTTLTFHFIQFEWEEEPGPEEEAATLSGRWTVRDVERLLSTYRYMRNIGRSIQEEPGLGRMKHMLEDLWRLLEIERSMAEEEVQSEGESPDPDMQKARQWLLEHACTPMTMQELAAALSLTPVQLTRRFRAAYQATPSEFVTGLRLTRACQLLEDSTQSIDIIAQQCGYENGFYLSRVFSAKLGLTPSKYRKLHRL